MTEPGQPSPPPDELDQLRMPNPEVRAIYNRDHPRGLGRLALREAEEASPEQVVEALTELEGAIGRLGELDNQLEPEFRDSPDGSTRFQHEIEENLGLRGTILHSVDVYDNRPVKPVYDEKDIPKEDLPRGTYINIESYARKRNGRVNLKKDDKLPEVEFHFLDDGTVRMAYHTSRRRDSRDEKYVADVREQNPADVLMATRIALTEIDHHLERP